LGGGQGNFWRRKAKNKFRKQLLALQCIS